MGTWVHLTALSMDREEAEAATEAALERMATLEARLSRFRAESELARLNRDGRLVDASDELLDLLRRADRFSELGDGAFDVTVQPLEQLYRERRDVGGPSGEELERALERVDRRAIRVEGRSVTLARGDMSVTLDGIGKGYIVDRGVETLQGLGYGDVFVEAGGDLVAAGDKGRAGPWRIGIRNPRPGGALHSRFEARDVAVATSGDYMQPFNADFSQHHILDPRTGRSAPELASSTVVAPDAATADALATLTMVLGPRRGRELLEALPGVEGLFIAKDLGVTRTSGFFTT
jgi:thiamine biosynthesis lipoprotein